MSARIAAPSPEQSAWQRGRRLLRIVDLKRTLAAETPELASATGFLHCYEVLSALDKSELAAILEHPTFDVWLDTAADLLGRNVHQTLPTGHVAAHLSRLARFAAVAALRAGFEVRLRYVLGPDTAVALPGLGYATFLPPSAAGGVATLDVSGPRIVVGLHAQAGEVVTLPRCGPALVDFADDDRTPGAGREMRWKRSDLNIGALDSVAAAASELLSDYAATSEAGPALLGRLRVVVPVRAGAECERLNLPLGLVTVEWPCSASRFAEAVWSALDEQTRRAAPESAKDAAEDGERWELTGGECAVVELCGGHFDPRRNVAAAQVVRRDSLQRQLGRMYVSDRARFDAVADRIADLPASSFQRLASAHVSYTRREFAAAAHSYHECLRDAPGDIDRWTDLAFSLRHLGHLGSANRILAAPQRVAAVAAGSGIASDTGDFDALAFVERLDW